MINIKNQETTKIHAADEEEKNKHDVGDRRMKITSDLASQQCVKLFHLKIDISISRSPQPDLVRMRDLDEHVFEGGAPLRELAQRPVSRGREFENFLAHIKTRFH